MTVGQHDVRSVRNDMRGFVYIIRERRTARYKIGWTTKNPLFRVVALSVNLSRDLELLWWTQAPSLATEQAMHRLCRRWRRAHEVEAQGHTEWFVFRSRRARWVAGQLGTLVTGLPWSSRQRHARPRAVIHECFSKPLLFNLTPEQHRALRETAPREGLTMSAFVRRALVRALREASLRDLGDA